MLRFLAAVSPRFMVAVLGRLLMKPPRRSVDPESLDMLDGAHRFAVWSGDRRLDAWSWGSGPTVLLVHGWGGRGAQFGEFVRPLVLAGRRVVAFDAPAHGRSGGSESSVVDMARAVMDVAAVVGDVDAVIAHSAGGAATTLALQAGLTARRLLYVAPALRPGGFLQRIMRLLGIDKRLRRSTRTFMERRVGRTFDELHADVATPQPAVELLIVHDENDRVVPIAEGRALAERWNGAQLVTTRGLGHSRVLHQPEVVSRGVAFVTANDHVLVPAPERPLR